MSKSAFWKILILSFKGFLNKTGSDEPERLPFPAGLLGPNCGGDGGSSLGELHISWASRPTSLVKMLQDASERCHKIVRGDHLPFDPLISGAIVISVIWFRLLVSCVNGWCSCTPVFCLLKIWWPLQDQTWIKLSWKLLRSVSQAV